MASKKWKNLQKGLPMSKQVTIVDKDSDRRVTILRDSKTAYPELWMEVFIGPGPRSETAPFAEYFAKARCTKADTPEEADLVVFVGGADVRSEEHTYELQSLLRLSSAVFCWKKNKQLGRH